MLEGFIMMAIGELVQQRFTDTESMLKYLGDTREKISNNKTLDPAHRLLLQQFLSAGEVFMGSMAKVLGDGSGTASRMPAMKLANIETVDVLHKPSKIEELASKLRSPWDISFPAAMMWGVMACVAGFAVSIVKERTHGTLIRLKLAPITPLHILGGKALGCSSATLAVIAMMTVLGLILGIQLASPGLLVLVAFCIAISFGGLMMVFSVIAKTEQAVQGAAWAVIVVMCMFGGGMMPLAFLPKFMTTISHFSPVKWGILALEGAIWRNFTFVELLPSLAVLLGIGVVGFATGVTVLSRQVD